MGGCIAVRPNLIMVDPIQEACTMTRDTSIKGRIQRGMVGGTRVNGEVIMVDVVEGGGDIIIIRRGDRVKMGVLPMTMRRLFRRRVRRRESRRKLVLVVDCSAV